jgi:hypothetical protein
MNDRELIQRARALLKSATKGPWVANEGWEQGDPGIYITGRGNKLVSAPEPEIMQPNDAALIAAAPVLLEELANALERQLNREA